jgi:hypothetical protein
MIKRARCSRQVETPSIAISPGENFAFVGAWICYEIAIQMKGILVYVLSSRALIGLTFATSLVASTQGFKAFA